MNDFVRRGSPLASPVEGNSPPGRPSGAPLQTSNGNFSIFQEFPELRVGIFGKDSLCTSDEECAAQLGFKKVSKLNQVHGNIIHITEKINGIPDGDGLITAQTVVALSVRWADCQAFAIYAPKQKVIGALHAGWKGMAAHAITKMYEALDAEFNVKPEETFIGMAPSLCKACADFSDPLHELPPHLHPFIDGKNVDIPTPPHPTHPPPPAPPPPPSTLGGWKKGVAPRPPPTPGLGPGGGGLEPHFFSIDKWMK